MSSQPSPITVHTHFPLFLPVQQVQPHQTLFAASVPTRALSDISSITPSCLPTDSHGALKSTIFGPHYESDQASQSEPTDPGPLVIGVIHPCGSREPWADSVVTLQILAATLNPLTPPPP